MSSRRCGPPKSDWERDTWTWTHHRGLSTSCPQPCLQVSMCPHLWLPGTPHPRQGCRAQRSSECGEVSGTGSPKCHRSLCPQRPHLSIHIHSVSTPTHTCLHSIQARPRHVRTCPHPPVPVHNQEETLFKGTAAASAAHGTSISAPLAGGPGPQAAASLRAGDPSQALQLLCASVSDDPSHGIPVYPGPGLYREQQGSAWFSRSEMRAAGVSPTHVGSKCI